MLICPLILPRLSSPSMYPYLFRTPWFFVYSYTAVFLIGILIGIGVTSRINHKFAIPNWFDGWLTGMAGAILAGRLGFVWLSRIYYQERPDELGLWRGGLNYHAALIGGLFLLGVWCLGRKRPFLTHLNLFTPALALISAFGWFACLLEGCAYGAETTLGPFAADLPDAFGVFAVRYQTQLIGIISSLIIFVITIWFFRQNKTSKLFALTMLALSLTQFGITFLRGDAITTFGTIRLDTLLDAIFVFISLILLKYPQQK
jgi:phosphatidylglycerol:prolipoprotein diacylglycerol transferase